MTATGRLSPDRPRSRVARADDADPDLTRLLGAVARAVLEVEVGRRPLWQLEGIVSPAVLGRLAIRDDHARRESRRRGRPIVGPGPSVVRTVVAQRISDDVCEGSVILDSGPPGAAPRHPRGALPGSLAHRRPRPPPRGHERSP